MKKIKYKLAAFLSCLSVLMCSCGDAKDESESIPVETEETTITETEKPHVSNGHAHVLAVGDNLPTLGMLDQAARRSGYDGYDFTYEYHNVRKLIEDADVAVINQEAMICGDKIPNGEYPRFNSPTALGNYMRYIGFDIFTIANNHILDYGTEGLSYSLDYWDSTESVVAGVYRNKADESKIRTFESNGIVFSILAYTENLNGNSLPDDSDYIIGDAYDFEQIESDIKKAHEISDVVMVALHWGVENKTAVSKSQRDVAQWISGYGADVIIGSHPHVVRDVEIIERADGKQTLVAYSLGNFVSAHEVRTNLIGGILEFDVNKKNDVCTIENARLTPTIQHYEKVNDRNFENSTLYLYSQYNDELAEKHGIHEISASEFNMEYITDTLKSIVSEEYLNLK